MDAHKQAIIHGSGQSNWRTPPALYAKLDATFHFDLDLAADRVSCLNLDYYGPGNPILVYQDAFANDWHARGQRGFLNPPYSLSEIKELKELGAQPQDYRHLLIDRWAEKAYQESLRGFTTVGVFPYAPQTEWFRYWVMGHQPSAGGGMTWRGHAALDYWTLPHRVGFLRPDGSPAGNAGVNTCIILWGPNPGWVGPWVPGGKYWTYR